jgi:cytochrome b subunit of formate dehydrogenase
MTAGSQVRSIVLTVVLCCIVLLCLLAFSIVKGIDISMLTRDPMAVAKGKSYWGALSNFGNLLWISGAAVAVFSGLVCKASKDTRAFLLAIGLLTAVLVLDDMFMLHEGAWPRLTGLDEKSLFVLYGASLLVILITGRRIWKPYAVTLFTAIGFFALSLILDRLEEANISYFHLFEDGSKFIGQACWSLFLWKTSQLQFDQHVSAATVHQEAHTHDKAPQ